MKSSLVIVLDRLRSAHNVGNIFRLAEALGAEVIGCGAEISEIYAEKGFDCVVIACELPADSERMTALREFCREKQIRIKKFSCTEKEI